MEQKRKGSDKSCNRERRKSEELSELEEKRGGRKARGAGEETGLMRYFLQINHPCTAPPRRRRRLDKRGLRAHCLVCFWYLRSVRFRAPAPEQRRRANHDGDSAENGSSSAPTRGPAATRRHFHRPQAPATTARPISLRHSPDYRHKAHRGYLIVIQIIPGKDFHETTVAATAANASATFRQPETLPATPARRCAFDGGSFLVLSTF